MGTLTRSAAASPATLIEIRAEDEQVVSQGDVLVRLDPKDYEVALAKAEADLADAEAALEL
jgi:membrane fusion protein (multidrug efflux system)